jgi:capsular polysaccharide biosynthesis protein
MATDPKRARRMANAVEKAFYERVSDVRLSAN